MSIIAHHLGLLVALWVVLILVGLQALVNVVQTLRGKVDIAELATIVSRPMLTDVLPLIILSWLTTIDGTGILVRIWYYAAAVLVAARAITQLLRAARR